ncbi:MAG: riboflavin synthase [Armatimonadetes bacterium]|nr:riboflavin synthase [Armatimonadota bacterium]
MFTGIVEEIGEIAQTQRRGMAVFFGIRASFAKELKQGDSVCINGACLTVVAIQPPVFWVEAVEETLARTNLGFLKPGDKVNLERALSVSGRFGGHFVQGHVDGTGVVAQIVPRLRSKVMRIHTPKELMPYIVPKGSIAVDGVSLTVVEVGEDWFTVSLIPFTLEHTTIGLRKVGDVVNLEVDILAKYVMHMLAAFKFVRSEGWETLNADERLKRLLIGQ